MIRFPRKTHPPVNHTQENFKSYINLLSSNLLLAPIFITLIALICQISCFVSLAVEVNNILSEGFLLQLVWYLPVFSTFVILFGYMYTALYAGKSERLTKGFAIIEVYLIAKTVFDLVSGVLLATTIYHSALNIIPTVSKLLFCVGLFVLTKDVHRAKKKDNPYIRIPSILAIASFIFCAYHILFICIFSNMESFEDTILCYILFAGIITGSSIMIYLFAGLSAVSYLLFGIYIYYHNHAIEKMSAKTEQ